jgi:Ca2+-binding EF-hand superfamily protein
MSSKVAAVAPPRGSLNNQIGEIFKIFDDNGDGSLSEKEIRDGFIRHGRMLSDEDIDEMIDEWDKDGDGSIDMGELSRLMAVPGRHRGDSSSPSSSSSSPSGVAAPSAAAKSEDASWRFFSSGPADSRNPEALGMSPLLHLYAREAFLLFDKDRSGIVDVYELIDGIRSLGVPLAVPGVLGHTPDTQVCWCYI